MADGSTAPDWRLAVDIGGTFTDCVLIGADDASYASSKVLSTRDDPAEGVLNGLAELAGESFLSVAIPTCHLLCRWHVFSQLGPSLEKRLEPSPHACVHAE